MLRILFLFFLLSSGLYANEASDRLDPVMLYSPRATLKTFMTSMNKYMKYKKTNPSRAELALKRASKTLNYRDVAPALKYEVSTTVPIYLKEVIDRIMIINLSTIPDDTKENSWTLRDTAIAIAKVQDGTDAGKYLFSPYTVDNAADFFHRVQDLPYVVKNNKGAAYERPWIESKIPPYLKVEFLGYQRWKYIGLILYALFGVVIKFLVTFLLGYILRLAEKK